MAKKTKELTDETADETTESLSDTPKGDDYYEEYVEVTLFKDGARYKNDVYVCINGENCIIKRGETVKVKRKFAELLKANHQAEIQVNEMQSRLSEEFEAKESEEK